MLTRIILVNVAVFVAMVVLNLTLGIFYDFDAPSPTFHNKVLPWFTLSADWTTNLFRPWVFITHMFLHVEFFHILWNMLLLYWFGRIVGDLLGDRRILPIYILAGLTGAMIYVLAASFNTPWAMGKYALGASAAVLGVLTAAAMTAPDYQIRLLFLGTVRLKYIIAVLILLDLIAISSNNNSGGSIAHLGGAFMGYIFVVQLQKGNDWAIPMNRFFDWVNGIFSGKGAAAPVTNRRTTAKVRQMKTNRKGNAAPKDELSHEARLNAILDKIKKEGMESLSEEEKEFLLKASKDH